MSFAITGARIFDGTNFHDGKAVTIRDGRISALLEAESVPSGIPRHQLDGGILVPGFIDIQVNGGGGALLNETPTLESVRTISSSHRKFGTVGLLPTVITDRAEVLQQAIAAVREARQRGEKSVLGIHVEGPFIDPKRKGAHEPAFIRAIAAEDMTRLANADCGQVVLTVAPNMVTPDQISELAKHNILVSLGHSDARYSEVRSALDAGALSFTHLFNAMSQLTGREPGMVGAALSDKTSFIGIIADGYHVDDLSMRIVLAATSHDRFMLVTDAMPPAAGGPNSFVLQSRTVTRVGDRLTLPDGTLAGSNLTMDAAIRHCVSNLELPLATALQMASRNPARFLGRQADLGFIGRGALASLTHLSDDLFVKATWVEGQ